MKRQSILVGTLILSVSSLVVRVMGFGFRVWLSNSLGAEGMGVYSLIMSMYSVSVTVATSGISSAVSKLAAEEFAQGKVANARKILRRAVSLSLLLSVSVGVLLYLLAEPVAVHILKDARTAFSLRLLAPGLPFLSVSSCIRGYCIASRNMLNPASGQVVEQVFKIAFIVALLGAYLPRGLEYACAVVVAGMTLGELICLVYTYCGYLLAKRRQRAEGKPTIQGAGRRILGFAVPISVSSYINSALRLLEDVLIVSGLKTFSGQDDVATGTYGILRGMVMPLLVFPLHLLSAFVMTLTPEVSRLQASSEKQRLAAVISRILQCTSIAGIFIVVALMTFSYEIGMAVYGDEQVGEMLRVMAWLCPFMCIEMVVVSILQGLGRQTSSAVYRVMDCVLRVTLVYILIPVRGVGGFFVMVVVSNLFTSMLNLRKLVKITELRLRPVDWLLKPAFAALCAGQMVRALYNLSALSDLPLWQGMISGIALIGICYTVLLFLLGCLTKADIDWVRRRFRLSGKAPQVAVDKGF